MSSIMWKSFNICLSKFKCFPTITFSPPPTATNVDGQDQDQDFPATTNPTLFKNFNSLYDANYSDVSTSKSLTFSSSTATAAAAAAATEEDFFSSSSNDSDDEWVPDFTSAFASHRFFFSSPGSSNSIFELRNRLRSRIPARRLAAVAVQTFSPDPYLDFKKSMVEMIEARDLTDVKADWEFLNELLLCYLTLNPKHTHKFIVSAFADVVVSLMSPAPPPQLPGHDCRKTLLQQHCTTSSLSI